MVKRYDFGPVQPEHHERDGGDWAHYSDYAALERDSHITAQALNSAMDINRRLDSKCAELEAECERLREENKMLKDNLEEIEERARLLLKREPT